jgi:RNA polymerase sigma-70 factor, ECF subfamily
MSGGYFALGREATHDDAFDFVFNAHYDYVYNLAHLLLRNPQDAEDVTQEVFLRVYKALPTFEAGPASMRTWLTRLATNACLTHRRRSFLRGLWQRALGDGDTPDPVDPSLWGAPEAHALRAEMRQTIKDVLGKLRIEHRTVLVLHYYLELSCPEIASILDCPEGTVYSRLYYARRIVQTQLERRALRPTNEVKP